MSFTMLALPLLLLGAPAAPIGEAASALPPAAVAAEAPAAPPPTRERTSPNVVFAEALGSGLLYSVNYERIIDAWNVGLRGGLSYFTYAVSSYGSSGNLTLVTFPVVASYYLGWRSHHLQLGLGGTVLYTDVATDSQGTKFDGERSGVGVAATGVVGYRFIPRDGGLSFGVGFTPLVRTSRFLPWGGANVGYAF
jgi:hypothetical protein